MILQHRFTTATSSSRYPVDWDAVRKESIAAPKSYLAHIHTAINQDVEHTSNIVLTSVMAILLIVFASNVARRASSTYQKLSTFQNGVLHFLQGFLTAVFIATLLLSIGMYCEDHLFEKVASYYRVLSTAIFHSTTYHKIQWSLISSKTKWLALSRSGVIMDVFELEVLKDRNETWVVEYIPFRYLMEKKAIAFKHTMYLILYLFPSACRSVQLCLNGHLMEKLLFASQGTLQTIINNVLQQTPVTLASIPIINNISANVDISSKISSSNSLTRYLKGMINFKPVFFVWILRYITEAIKQYFSLGARNKESQSYVHSIAELESKISHLLPPSTGKANCKYIIECVTDIASVINTNETLLYQNEELIDQVAEMQGIIVEQEVELERLRQEALNSVELEDWCRHILLVLQDSEQEQDNEVTPRACRRLPISPPGSPTMKTSWSGATLRGSSSQNLINWYPPL